MAFKIHYIFIFLTFTGGFTFFIFFLKKSLSSILLHLCLALSDSLLKHLPHTLHFTSRGAISLLLCWSCVCLKSPSLHVTYQLFSMLCLLIPASLLDPYSLQVTLHQISPSSSWTSLGACLRKPAKQGDLWNSLRGHFHLMDKPLARHLLMSLVIMVSSSPPCSLIILEEMCSSHCCVQVISKMVRVL